MKLRPYLPFMFYTYLTLYSFTQICASEIESTETEITQPVLYTERAHLQSECEESDYSSFTNNLQYRDEVTPPQNPIKLLQINEFTDYPVIPIAVVIYLDLLSYCSVQGIVIGTIPLLLWSLSFLSFF